MCKIKKISCVAITDHNTIEGALKFKKKYEKKGIEVIVGEEIMTSNGEIIGLFLKEEIRKGMTPDETIEAIINQGGLVYIPHPFDLKRKRTVIGFEDIKRNKKRINFIESYNGRNILKEYGVEQNKIANELNIIKVIGSDAHTIFELGRNYMEIENFYNKEEFIKSISNAKFIESPCLKICHLITKCDKLAKIILKGDFNELFRTINKRIRR